MGGKSWKKINIAKNLLFDLAAKCPENQHYARQAMQKPSVFFFLNAKHFLFSHIIINWHTFKMDFFGWFRRKVKIFSFILLGGASLYSPPESILWKCLSCTLQCDSWFSKITFIIDITTQCRGSHDVRDAATIYNLTSVSSPPHLSPSPEVRTFLAQKKNSRKRQLISIEV